MTRRSVLLALAVTWGLSRTPGVAGQSVLDALETLPPDVAEAWVAPLPRSLGPALVSGLFSDARPRGMGPGVSVGLGFFERGHRTFRPPLPASVAFGGTTYQEPYTLEGGSGSPTVAGAGPGARLVPRSGSDFEAALTGAGQDPASHHIPLPHGTDLRGAPVPMVEMQVGLASLAAVTGRFFPRMTMGGDLGDVGGFGAGLLLSIDRFLPLPGFDGALTFGLQELDVGGYLDASARAPGALVSTRFGAVRAYAHAQRARWTVDLRWRTRNPGGIAGLPADEAVQALHFDPGHQHRLAMGASLDLPPVAVGVEVSTSMPRVVSARLTLLRR